jgi:hypothetical protein
MENVSPEQILSIAYTRWGLSPRRFGKEYHAPCFKCGGRDRLIIFSDGGYYCRQCQVKGWLDDDKKHEVDPLAVIMNAERIARERAIQEKRNADWEAGYRAGYWRGWHDGMNQANRWWWNSQGISNHLIDRFGLGYNPRKTIETPQGEMTLPAYTIPIRDPETDNVINIQYRLADSPAGIGKYRQESGITAAAFYAEPNCIAGDDAIVLEGAKKAIVVWDRLDAAIQVVGLPGCTPGEIVLEKLKVFKRIWLALDPGTEHAAKRIKKILPQARVMRLPDKPDDIWLRHGMTIDLFREYMRQAA